MWDRASDSFRVRVTNPRTADPTPSKRFVLSRIARLFDPLGWVAPVPIFAKIFIQNLWVRGLDWDEPLPEDLAASWRDFQAKQSGLEVLRVPRWVHTGADHTLLQVHGFSDASKRAYAATVYLRAVGANGEIHTSLLAAKTKVDPVKTVSVPRLEVCGAVLLTRLLVLLRRSLHLANAPIFAFGPTQR